MEKDQKGPVTISFVGDQELKEWLDKESATTGGGRSRSSLMREIIEFYQKYRNLPDSLLEDMRAKLEPAGNGC